MELAFSEILLFLVLSCLLLVSPGESFERHDVLPVFNPVTTPTTSGGQPGVVTVPITVTPPNPITGFPGSTYPTSPVGGSSIPGGSWCVARTGVAEAALQAALDYACGIGGVDCAAIQTGAACFYPDSLQTHTSFAFNSYYQRNPVPSSCDFGGAAAITTINPSFGSCIFTTGSPGTATGMASPAMVNPLPPQTTDPLSGVPQTGSGAQTVTNPAMGSGITGFGDIIPPPGNSLPVSASRRSQSHHLAVLFVLAMAAFAARIDW